MTCSGAGFLPSQVLKVLKGDEIAAKLQLHRFTVKPILNGTKDMNQNDWAIYKCDAFTIDTFRDLREYTRNRTNKKKKYIYI